jgi:hypothetical protein
LTEKAKFEIEEGRLNEQNYFNVLDGLNIPKIVSRDYNVNLVEMLLQASKL